MGNHLRDRPGIDAQCFLTHHNGATYLWTSAPYVVVYGGKISYIRGAKPELDILVIDFNLSEESRTPDTVAYKRVAQKSE